MVTVGAHEDYEPVHEVVQAHRGVPRRGPDFAARVDAIPRNGYHDVRERSVLLLDLRY